MKVINHKVELLDVDYNPLNKVEFAARTCYQSEPKDSDPKRQADLVRRLIKNGHTAMIEFASIGFRIVTDRGVSHELVRHRIASFAQESTRYCNYGGKDMEFILPVQFKGARINEACRFEWDTNNHPGLVSWLSSMEIAERNYNEMLAVGCSPQIARSVLPNSLKTEICVQFNMRSFRNFVTLRTAKTAHPDMQVVANLCVDCLRGTDYMVFIEDLVEK